LSSNAKEAIVERDIVSENTVQAELKKAAQDAASEQKTAARDAHRERQTEQWKHTVEGRLQDVRVALKRNQKRAMTFGGIALVLLAIGPALILNRALNVDAATQLPRLTLAILCLAGAAIMTVAWIWIRRRQRAAAETQATRGTQDSDGWSALPPSASTLAILGMSLLIASGSPNVRLGHGSLCVGFVCGAMGLVVIAVYYNRKVHRDEQDLSDLQFEHDLLRYKVEPFESRAEKLLSVNQIQLRRYYELNLQQARGIFLVGIGCIAAGLVVVGVTFWLVWLVASAASSFTNKEHTQTIVALVGAVGTVLTNFVAALYFRMHHLIGKSLVEFHGKLARTHDLFFANVLAASIRNKPERSQTLASLALAITERQADKRADIDRKGTDAMR